jgi:hypothetical protein
LAATPPVDATRDSVAAPSIDREVLRSLQRSALEARARATAAGATRAQLAHGNAIFADAERMLRTRRYAEAVTAYNGALASWVAASVAAGSQHSSVAPAGAVPNATSARTQIESDSVRPTTPPPRPAPPVVQPPVVVPSSPSPSAATTHAEPDAASALTEIGALVTAYARAIQARDVAAIRGLYPSITDEQQRGFERFFAAVKSLKASLSAGTPEVNGPNASARIAGTYEYVDATGQAQRQPVAFQATFRRDGTNWRIASVR